MSDANHGEVERLAADAAEDGMNRAAGAAPRSRWIVGLVAALIVGLGAGWAGATVFTPPADVLDATAYTYVEVSEGEVGSSLSLAATAEWKPVPLASNLTSGTVTSVEISQGQEVTAGTTLYHVNLRPVVLAQGEVPAFRDLASEMRGDDVAQLQAFLASIGYFSGSVDGNFGWETEDAVRRWQADIGVDDDGVVRAGDVLFAPTLPVRVALDTKLVFRGANLPSGAPALSALPSAPAFSIAANTTQAGMMAPGTRVELTSPDGVEWTAVTDVQQANDTGVLVSLVGEGGDSLCGDECSSVPVTGQTVLQATIFTVEPQSGLVVPAAAITSSAEGTLSVIDEHGTPHTITLVSSARGMALIEGVDEGLRVRVPAGS